ADRALDGLVAPGHGGSRGVAAPRLTMAVVRLDAGKEAVRAYVAAEAVKGRDHVVNLIKSDRDAILGASDDLTSDEANFQPGAGEFWMTQVLEHLDLSMARSVDRIRSLSPGAASTYSGPPARRGGLPDEPPENFAVARQVFLDGTNAVLEVIEAAD